MTVRKDADGRRAVTVEVEVPGTPEAEERAGGREPGQHIEAPPGDRTRTRQGKMDRVIQANGK